MTSVKSAPKRPLTGKAVSLWLGGFFGIVIGVNAIMSWFAVTTFSGVETSDAYTKGRDFNDQIAADEKQRAQGWVVAVEVQALSALEVFLTVTISQKDGTPLDGAQVSGLLVRSVAKGLDQSLTFAPLGQGRYGGAVRVAVPGKWQVRAQIKGAAGATHRIIHDIMVSS